LHETWCFIGKRRFNCGEKLARVRGGFGHRRFAVEFVSNCIAIGIKASRWLFLCLCWRCAIVSICSVANGVLAAGFSILVLMIFRLNSIQKCFQVVLFSSWRRDSAL
jgi:hypothetical protein